MSLSHPDLDVSPVDEAFDWPLFGLQDDVRPVLASAAARGVRAVLATLYGVVGGAPRGVGAQMAFVEDEVAGFLSGGCIEADLALLARGVLADGRGKCVVYGEGGPVDVRLPCGSRIEILLEAIEPDDKALRHLLEYAKARRPALWLTDGEQRRCVPAETIDAVRPPLCNAAERARASKDICGFVEDPFAIYRVCAPPVRLVVMGGDPVALAVVKLGVEMGLQTHLIRPHGPEACPIPGVRYSRATVQSALATCRPDLWTAIAVLTHDLDQEQAALTAALATQARYVGALGSRRRTPERNARLRAAGVTTADIERLHAPIGLPIGGNSPWEIAVSIIAEIVNTMGGRASKKADGGET